MIAGLMTLKKYAELALQSIVLNLWETLNLGLWNPSIILICQQWFNKDNIYVQVIM